MDILTISELMHLTRDELCDLSQRIERCLAEIEPRRFDRSNVLTSLNNIRRAMLLRGLYF